MLVEAALAAPSAPPPASDPGNAAAARSRLDAFVAEASASVDRLRRHAESARALAAEARARLDALDGADATLAATLARPRAALRVARQGAQRAHARHARRARASQGDRRRRARRAPSRRDVVGNFRSEGRRPTRPTRLGVRRPPRGGRGGRPPPRSRASPTPQSRKERPSSSRTLLTLRRSARRRRRRRRVLLITRARGASPPILLLRTPWVPRARRARADRGGPDAFAADPLRAARLRRAVAALRAAERDVDARARLVAETRAISLSAAAENETKKYSYGGKLRVREHAARVVVVGARRVPRAPRGDASARERPSKDPSRVGASSFFGGTRRRRKTDFI